MKHYERALQRDLDSLRSRVSDVGVTVGRAVREAIDALAAFDKPRLYRVVLDDHPINRETRAIDRACHQFVAIHLPAAGPLRFVSSVLRMTIALERIGDYAVTIARIGARLDKPHRPEVLAKLAALTDHAVTMLEAAMGAWVDEDPELARDTMRLEKKIDAEHDALFFETVQTEWDWPLVDRVGLLSTFHRLERVSDQAKNICEEAIFVATGETKAAKTYRVHFVDASNRLQSQLAVALARKSFPESGRYSSAGWEPASELHPALLRAAVRLSLDLDTTRPTKVRTMRETPPEFHVVVVIDGGAAPPLPRIPFHTVLLRWDVGGPPPEGTAEADAHVDEMARQLSSYIRDLMVTLRGEAAS